MSLQMIFVLCGALYIAWCFYSLINKKSALYVDTNGAQVFYSKKYNIAAKPDAIIDKHTIEEKKSRQKGIYPSDRAQMMATAIAVRSKYPIRKGYLVTSTGRHEVDLSASDAELFSMIEEQYKQGQLLNRGKAPPANPAKHKCRGCQFKNRCEFSSA